VAICIVPGWKKSSMHSSEYTLGFSDLAASHLAGPPSASSRAEMSERLLAQRIS
jgi:hypothetical protein